jgi:selenide,water dikinase
VDLEAIVKELDIPAHPDVLVGLQTGDDAGVYRIGRDLSMVLTADFIAPTCDDPYLFGRIAAANSLSDVYAMGGTPKAALNLCCFPPKGVDKQVLTEILRGGLETATEAGAALVGGHTVKDNELKYGLSVTGLVHDKDLKTNGGARVGDILILTKPIGTGVIMAAVKKGILPESDALPVMNRMAQLNKIACELMIDADAGGATDVTGFGLAGHAWEMAAASKAGLRFRAADVPCWPLAEKLVRDGVKTGVKLSSGQAQEEKITISDGIASERRALFTDPQTSGGLLIAVAENEAPGLIQRLADAGIENAAICGEVFPSDHPIVEFQP